LHASCCDRPGQEPRSERAACSAASFPEGNTHTATTRSGERLVVSTKRLLP
jgi:hypothetical protein